MSNMSYCRFQNTLSDLQDCADNITEKLDTEEAEARDQLMWIVRDLAEKYPKNYQFEVE
jgi:hypothetical protein